MSGIWNVEKPDTTGYAHGESNAPATRDGTYFFRLKTRCFARFGEMYDAIVAYKRAHDGNSPSVRNLMAICNYNSTAAVMHALEALEAEGLITRGYNISRHICVAGGAWTHGGAHDAELTPYASMAWTRIVEYKQAHDGNAPTIHDLMVRCRFSSKSVTRAAVVELRTAQLVRMPPDPIARHLEVVGGQWTLAGGE